MRGWESLITKVNRLIPGLEPGFSYGETFGLGQPLTSAPAHCLFIQGTQLLYDYYFKIFTCKYWTSSKIAGAGEPHPYI